MLISFGSTSHAIRGERVLLDDGIKVVVMPLPSKIRAGCGIALKIELCDIDIIKKILTKHQIEFEVHTL